MSHSINTYVKALFLQNEKFAVYKRVLEIYKILNRIVDWACHGLLKPSRLTLQDVKVDRGWL